MWGRSGIAKYSVTINRTLNLSEDNYDNYRQHRRRNFVRIGQTGDCICKASRTLSKLGSYCANMRNVKVTVRSEAGTDS
jgi:hypothetical protein